MKRIFAAIALAGLIGGLSVPSRAEVMVASMSPTLCMDWNTSNNKIALWGCHGGYNQDFFNSGYGQQRYGNLCLDHGPLRQGYPNGDGDLVMAQCQPNKASQNWLLVSDLRDPSPGRLRSQEGYCANIPNSRASQGTQLIVYQCQRGNQYNDVWARGAYGSAASAGLKMAPTAPLPPPGSIGNVSGGRLIGQDGSGILVNGGGSILGNSAAGLKGASGATVMQAGGNAIRITGGSLISN